VRTDIPYLRRRVKPAPPATEQPEEHEAESSTATATNSTHTTRTYEIPLANDPRARKAPPTQPEPAREPHPEREPEQSPAPRTSSAGLSLSPSAPAAPTSTSSSTSLSSSSSLSLSPSTPASAAAPATSASRPAAPTAPAGSLPFEAPTIDELRELDEDEPVLRLNARESAIGSLIVSGATFAAWEDPERVTGSVTAAGGTAGSPVTTSGNRPLIGLDESDALVALRHVGQLRRALFIGRGPEILGVQIFDGATVTIAAGDTSRMFVLYMLRVGNLIELRAEPVDRSATDDSILKQFGFTLTPYLPPRESRSR
jgi:hypothetical protein